MCHKQLQTKYKYSLFEVYGVELEYMIVNKKSLDVAPISDLLFQSIHGDFISEIEDGQISLNNELALHVIELKTTNPTPQLSSLAKPFHEELQKLNTLLSKWEACLMPSAMHPWMNPHKETKLWQHESAEIYNTFNAIFNCSGHGWGNLQSTHLNLPFSSEEEFIKLHRSVRIVLPLIPTISASSPFIDGKKTSIKDNRLNVYRYNCKRISSVTGHIIPEVCNSYEMYHTKILNKIYKDISPHDLKKILCHEWLNARGAITRFERGSIEIRLIDIQETPFQDIAILEAFSLLIKYLLQKDEKQTLHYDQFSEERLKGLLEIGILYGEESVFEDTEYLHLFGIKQSKMRAKDLWKHIFTNLIDISKENRLAIDLLLKEGTLATRLINSVGEKVNKTSLYPVYESLCQCLQKGAPFLP
jgi:gamma-glutamyl:cysteine ligase YbdK (ATP-grasp superfamily)